MSTLNFIIEIIVEILTTIFPISRFGHQSLLSHFMGQKVLSLPLSLAIRLSLIIPIIFIFRKTFLMLMKESITILKEIKNKKFTFKVIDNNRKILFLLLCSSIISILSFLFTVKVGISLSNDFDIIVEGAFLIITGLILLFADRKMPGEKLETDIKIYDFIVIGLLISLSNIPGLSGNAMVLAYLIFRNFNRELSFSIATITLIPHILISTIYDSTTVLPKINSDSPDAVGFLIAILVSLILGLLILKLTQSIIRADRINIFSNYLVFIGGIVLILGIIESILKTTAYEFITNILNIIG